MSARTPVLVGPGGQVVEGEGPINMTAYYIHAPIHDARPESVSVAHTHTPYATPWVANVRPFRMICQEATAFFRSQAIFEGEEVQVMDAETGKHIAAALDEAKLVFLRNHGPVTVGQSVEETIGWFLLAERVAEVHIKAPDALPITDQAAFIASAEIGHPSNAVAAYEYAIMSHIPDPSVVSPWPSPLSPTVSGRLARYGAEGHTRKTGTPRARDSSEPLHLRNRG